MGLDISAASRLEHAGKEPKGFDWDENYERYFKALCPHPTLVYSTRGLVLDDLYMLTDESETIGFRAGSYGGYNRWRETLVEHTDNVMDSYWKDRDESLPFYELVNFSDCEGTIGPLAAADLLVDFEQYRESYALAFEAYDLERYDEWTMACKLAANNGIIDFH